MEIARLCCTQRGLKRAKQIPTLMEGFYEPVELNLCPDGEVEIHNGHHRVVSIWMTGRTVLRSFEYILLIKDEQRTRFGKLPEWLTRIFGDDVTIG